MVNDKKLRKIALGVGGTGLLVLIYSFFSLYGLVGDCPNGRAGCSAYTHWQLINKAGLVLLCAGIALFAVWLYRQRPKK